MYNIVSPTEHCYGSKLCYGNQLDLKTLGF